jgi:sodium/hydrogen antiporter
MNSRTQTYSAQEFLRNADPAFFGLDIYDLILLISAVVVLAAALVPRLLAKQHITAPLLFLSIGVVVSLLPVDWQLPDLVDDAWWPKRLTELGVIIALTSAGLKLNKPFSRDTWRISWRLLAITMPLTICATAFIGWWMLGLVPATAILFGAVIAPTDPVLASDVQTTAPGADDDSPTRVALTTEAGLNDGLAFPFTNLAIAVALVGLDPAGWFVGWFVMDFFYKILAGVLVGAASGRLLAMVLFKTKIPDKLSHTMTGIVALSLTLFPYAAAELASSYGFIAVFVAACVFRQYETHHTYQRTLHDFSEELERLLVAVLMFLMGVYLTSGVLVFITFPMVIVLIVTVFVIRPVSGLLALTGCGLSRSQQWAVAFFGIRGIGSIYYMAYAVYHANFPQAREIWTLVILIVVVSVMVHGLSAKPVMGTLDRLRRLDP